METKQRPRAEPQDTEQPQNDIAALYTGALRALPGLWRASEAVAKAGGAEEGALSWGLKKLMRVKKKLVEKYGGQPNMVTDVARTSIIFPTLAGRAGGGLGISSVCGR